MSGDSARRVARSVSVSAPEPYGGSVVIRRGGGGGGSEAEVGRSGRQNTQRNKFRPQRSAWPGGMGLRGQSGLVGNRKVASSIP